MEFMGPGVAEKFKLKGSGVCQKTGIIFRGSEYFYKFIPGGV